MLTVSFKFTYYSLDKAASTLYMPEEFENAVSFLWLFLTSTVGLSVFMWIGNILNSNDVVTIFMISLVQFSQNTNP